MTLYTHAGSLPRHQYVWVEPNAMGEHDWLQAVWFGLTSYPGRAWGCHVLLECGAVYRNVPLHMLMTHRPEEFIEVWTVNDAQLWNCYGWQFSTIEYPYLSGLTARARVRNGAEYEGTYLFTAVPVGDGFTAAPEQAKEFSFIALDNGRITAQPTNRVLFEERSFTGEMRWPTFLRRQTVVWTCED